MTEAAGDGDVAPSLAAVPHSPESVRRALAPVADPVTGEVVPVPCAARPSTTFLHRDGPCRCFFGGPAPEFAPVTLVG